MNLIFLSTVAYLLASIGIVTTLKMLRLTLAIFSLHIALCGIVIYFRIVYRKRLCISLSIMHSYLMIKRIHFEDLRDNWWHQQHQRESSVIARTILMRVGQTFFHGMPTSFKNISSLMRSF